MRVLTKTGQLRVPSGGDIVISELALLALLEALRPTHRRS